MNFSVSLRQHQADAIDATRAHDCTWLCGGLGSGKTYVLAYWVGKTAIFGSKGLDGRPVDGLIVEPDFDTFYDVFMPEWRKIWPEQLWALTSTNKGNSKQLEVRTSYGGKCLVYIRSAMNAQTVQRIDGLSTIGWFALDEPSRMHCGERAFNSALGRARVPMASGRNVGLIVGSPRGFNWLATAFAIDTDHPPHAYERGYSSKPGYFVRACRTTDNAPHLDSGYADRLVAAYGERFAQQELNASMVRAQGQIFPDWYRSVHVVPDAVAEQLWAGTRKRIGGADWGYTAPASVLACGINGDREVVVVDEWYHDQRQPHEQCAEAQRMSQRWGIHEWRADPAEPGNLALWRNGCEWAGQHYQVWVHEADNDWTAGINKIRACTLLRRGLSHPVHGEGLGRPRLFVAERCENLIREMASYTMKPVKEDQPPSEGSVGPDHAIDALRYAVSALEGSHPTTTARMPI